MMDLHGHGIDAVHVEVIRSKEVAACADCPALIHANIGTADCLYKNWDSGAALVPVQKVPGDLGVLIPAP